MDVLCPDCFAPLSSGAQKCPKCGKPVDYARLAENQRHMFAPPQTASVHPKFKVFENPANGYRITVKTGYSWGTVWLGPLNYFFNRMYGRGLTWLLFNIIVSPILFFFFIIGSCIFGPTSPLNAVGTLLGFGAPLVVWCLVGFRTNQEIEEHLLYNGWKLVKPEGRENVK